MKIFDDFVNWICSIFERKERNICNHVIIGDNNVSSSSIVGNRIRINGKSINVPNGCRSLVIKNNEVWVDGKKLSEEDGLVSTDKVINIQIEGQVDSLNVNHCNNLSVTGNVNDLVTNSGDVTVHGIVYGDVSTSSGDVSVGQNCSGINTNSGDVEVDGSVSGDVSTTSGEIDIDGDVSGDIQSSSGDIDIMGSVGGNVTTKSGDVSHR